MLHFKLLQRSVDGEHLMRFHHETFVFKFLWRKVALLEQRFSFDHNYSLTGKRTSVQPLIWFVQVEL